jgi:hypothetical protein
LVVIVKKIILLPRLKNCKIIIEAMATIDLKIDELLRKLEFTQLSLPVINNTLVLSSHIIDKHFWP